MCVSRAYRQVRRLKIKAMAIARKTDRTAAQETTIVEMRTRLSHSLARFRLMQARYMPPVLPFLSHRVVPDEEDIESVPLLLPSSLNSADRQLCGSSLGKIEYQLREARCHRFLNELRNLLFIKSRLVGYKDRNARHQGANTRTRTLINRNEDKIRLQVDRYRRAWEALQQLSEDSGSDRMPVDLQELKQEHVRCMEDPDSLTKKHVRRLRRMERGREDVITVSNEERTSGDEEDEDEEGEQVVAKEGYRTVSWLWTNCSGKGVEGMNEGVYNLHTSILS